METYEFSRSFQMGNLLLSPVHVRVEELRPVIAAHRHSNTSYELHYTQAGHGTVTIDKRSGVVEAGTLYVTGPGIVHAQRSDPGDPVIEYCLYLNCERLDAAETPFTLFSETTFWMGRDEGRISQLLLNLIEENRTPQPETPELSEALLKEIVIALVRLYRRNTPVQVTHTRLPITRAGLIPIAEDAFFYRYRSLTLKDLAALINLSERQTQRFLRARFGKTFSQKLTEARMAAAMQFLSDTALSVTEIGERTGYSSAEHFSTAFRKNCGCSPREYRKRTERA